jgi:hypothetical protein
MARLWGCFAVLFIDSVSGFKRAYGVNSKSDLADAVRRWCAAVVACGHAAPHVLTRFGAEATKHGELTAGFGNASTELHLTLLLPPPKKIRRPIQPSEPGRRLTAGWPTCFAARHPMKDSWLAVPSLTVFDATVCHGDNMHLSVRNDVRLCSDMQHDEFFGQTVMWPAVVDPVCP